MLATPPSPALSDDLGSAAPWCTEAGAQVPQTPKEAPAVETAGNAEDTRGRRMHDNTWSSGRATNGGFSYDWSHARNSWWTSGPEASCSRRSRSPRNRGDLRADSLAARADTSTSSWWKPVWMDDSTVYSESSNDVAVRF